MEPDKEIKPPTIKQILYGQIQSIDFAKQQGTFFTFFTADVVPFVFHPEDEYALRQTMAGQATVLVLGSGGMLNTVRTHKDHGY